MPKRFTDTDKYKKPFFRSLRGAYKLLWDYLYHNCDNAGIWIKDFEIAQTYIGTDMPISEEEALKVFAARVIVFDGGSKWFIPSFIEFQYDCGIDDLNPKNNAHLSVIKKLKKEGLMSPSRGAQDKYKDKEEDKDKEKDKYITVENEKIYDALPRVEFYEASLNARQKEHQTRNWRDVLPEWFAQNILMDFKDDKHLFNSFSKYLITTGKVNARGQPNTNGQRIKLTLDDITPKT